MADMDFDDYRAMVEESPVETAIESSATIVGRGPWLVMPAWWIGCRAAFRPVYSFYDAQDPRRGLGTHMIVVG